VSAEGTPEEIYARAAAAVEARKAAAAARVAT